MVTAEQIDRAPPPGQKTLSRYPHVYRNDEGPKDRKFPSFEPKEIPRVNELYEYPVAGANQRIFDFNKKKSSLKEVNRPVEPKDRARAVKNPLNDAGSIRGVGDKSKNVVGVIAHPEGNIQGFERAYQEPLSTQGRQQVRRYQDHVSLSRSRSWPTR